MFLVENLKITHLKPKTQILKMAKLEMSVGLKHQTLYYNINYVIIFFFNYK